MKEALLQNIQDIERQCKIIKSTIEKIDIPSELVPFREWIYEISSQIQVNNEDNEYYLKLNRPTQFRNLYIQTQKNVSILRFVAERYVHVLNRYQKDDNFCIKFIAWLHQQHKQSVNRPFGLSNDGFSIRPTVDIPMIYYLPTSSQLNLLHFPLFFHEFGHFLYAFHQKEVEDLIKELQSKISENIAIVSEENTASNERKREKNIWITETWFSWMQEFYCDAVGLHIGGKSYLHIFSLYLRTSGNASFYMNEESLKGCSHPVSWLRIKFLAHRAAALGLEKEAKDLTQLWQEMANVLNIKEKYHGYYEESFFEIVNQCLDDMIEETNPICFKDCVQKDNQQWQSMNFIELVNFAWDNYLENFETYSILENEIIAYHTAQKRA